MDITLEFHKYASAADAGSLSNTREIKMYHSSSPLIIMAGNLLRRLQKMQEMINSSYDSYVEFHNFLVPDQPALTAPDRAKLDHDVAAFAISWASELNELKANFRVKNEGAASTILETHYALVFSYLFDRLQNFNRRAQQMQKARNKLHKSPYRLISPAASAASALATNDVSHSSKQAKLQKQTLMVANDFSARYTAEVAPPAKLRDYEQFAMQHRNELFAESKQLSEKYSEELEEAMRIEQTASSIASMMNEFVYILRSQSILVEDVHDSSKLATQHVKETDEQLLLTLDRSKTYRTSMIVLIIGMAAFLLFLDFVHP